MPSGSASTSAANGGTGDDFNALVIGSGLSGLYMLFRLRQLNVPTTVLEQAPDVGGTWWWNAYPGARFDSESYSYAMSFGDPDDPNGILQEFNWTERFAGQNETLGFINRICEKYDLKKDVQFNSRVVAARFLEDEGKWEVTLESGETKTARFLISAVGVLSAPVMPLIDGIDSFKGESYHTAKWPHTPVSFEGKRVAVIGTGASGIQTIQEVAKTAQTLTVFQRTPNWTAPLHNGPLSKEEMDATKKRYNEIFQRCRETWMCFLHHPDPRSALEVTAEEREAFWEKQYNSPGFGMWQGNFRDCFIDEKANALVSDFVARKIRQRVKDPLVAEKLIPKNHGFGTRRVPLETRYLEVYNQPNVELVSLLETPIERVTEKGIKTSDKEFDFDLIIYATGFLAVTGSFERMDITGKNGITLKQSWEEGPRTLLGFGVDNFPNLLMIIGPHCALGNIPRSIDFCVDWISRLLTFMLEKGYKIVEAKSEAVEEWNAHVKKVGEGLLSSKVDSWMTGVNTNVAGKQKRIAARYGGSAPAYRERANVVADGGYKEFSFA